MRPRVFPAEDPLFPSNHAPTLAPSMRPRVFPAEDSPRRRAARGMQTTFNEAAGIPRGRPEQQTLLRVRERPSMRPRVFPAEDLSDVRCLDEAADRLQ